MEYKTEGSVCASNVPSDYQTQKTDIQDLEKLHLLKEGISETIAENNALSAEIITLLKELKLEINYLPIDIKEGLQNVSLILKSEGLAEVDETALMICREQRRIQERKNRLKDKQLKVKYNMLFDRYKNLEKKLTTVQDAVVSVKDITEKYEADSENHYTNEILMNTKLNEYKEALDKLIAELDSMDVADLDPDTIRKKSKKFLEVQGELAEVNQFLKQYGNVPPNLLQAKALVAAKQKEYENICLMVSEESNYN
ncbi:uncharacterized protein LOC107269138 [Cephus cinctus]|uniref:Uncharacterized protein LOC107269138 n=1 Tax=Cephus cinctus TaxID=211228 RepID=A0AAJ7BZB8_CEPCN|nr:uncharacterized protein LOC107269138 [Cephus cinctus]